ncbi:nuclease [Salmonella enterica]|nr:nuclease [Salmonella enterica]
MSVIIFSIPSVYAKTVNVYYVIDGDTFVYKDNEQLKRVRLYCIDAPEKSQQFGLDSKEILASIILHKNVDLEIKGKDRYGREIALVSNYSHVVNLEMVSKGAAWVYNQYCQDNSYYISQEFAKRNKFGMWALGSNIPPWEYRREH